MENIKNINISQLIDFPRQAEIYGEPDVEPEFVASVQHRGIITPLIVAENGTDGIETYLVVSGHRRKKAADLAELIEIPCIVRKYESEEEMELEFLAANMQREKTKSMRVKEFFYYKQILCQIGKVRKSKGIYANTVFENEHFFRILKNNGLESYAEPGKPQNSVEILKEITEYSRYEQEHLTVIYDMKWLERKMNELRGLGLSADGDDAIMEAMGKIRSDYENEAITLNEASKTVKNMFLEAEKKLAPPKKAKKADKPKTEKPKEPELPKPVLAVATKLTNTVNWFYNHDEVAFGVEFDSNGSILNVVADVDDLTYTLNLDLLAHLMRGEI